LEADNAANEEDYALAEEAARRRFLSEEEESNQKDVSSQKSNHATQGYIKVMDEPGSPTSSLGLAGRDSVPYTADGGRPTLGETGFSMEAEPGIYGIFTLPVIVESWLDVPQLDIKRADARCDTNGDQDDDNRWMAKRALGDIPDGLERLPNVFVETEIDQNLVTLQICENLI